MKLIDKCDLIDRDEQFIVVGINNTYQCQLKKKGNFIYVLRCLNGMMVYKVNDMYFNGYRNLTAEEYNEVIEYVRNLSKVKNKRGK